MTNDGATILSLLDIEHPAGKILVDLAQQQDREVHSPQTVQCLLRVSMLIDSSARSVTVRRLSFYLLPNSCDAPTN